MPSKSKAQQKFMGMVHSLQKGDMKPSDASPEVKKAAKSMSDKDAKDYASTKHKGLPKRVRQEILNKLKEYASKMGTNTMGGDDYTSKKKGGLRDFDGYDNVDYNKDMPMDESINEACWKGYKEVGGKIKNGKRVPNCVPVGESIDEGMMSTIDQIRKDSKSVRDFIKKVLSDKDFRDMKSDKDFIKYLGSIYEGVLQESHYTAVANLGTKKAKENLDSFDELQKFMDKMKSRKAISVQVTKINGSKKQTINYDWDGRNWVSKNKKGVKENFPSNWMQGRTSDYHTKLRGKKRDYDDTNFDKENSGQTDLEEGGFDKVEHLKLLNKAMKAMPGSSKQKDIIRKLNIVRKAGGMRPLKEVTKPDFNSKGYKEASKLVAKLRSSVFRKMSDDDLDQFRMVLAQAFDLKEYGSKLTEPFLLPKDEDKLDGTPKDKMAIDDAVDKSDLKNAKNRLKDPHTIEDIEYSKTRRGDKFVKIIYKKKYVPGKMMDTGPHFVSVFYTDEKDLQNIGKALKLKLKESVSEETKRDYKAEYKKFQSSTKSKKYRAELNKYNRQKGTYGNGDGKDASHKGGKIVGFESESKNRGRREKSRLKKK